MAHLRVIVDPSVPKYTLLYTSSPAASPEEHEVEHAKYFRVLRDLLQKQGVDSSAVQLEVQRLPCESVNPKPAPIPGPPRLKEPA